MLNPIKNKVRGVEFHKSPRNAGKKVRYFGDLGLIVLATNEKARTWRAFTRY